MSHHFSHHLRRKQVTDGTPDPSVQTGKSVLIWYSSVWTEMGLVVSQLDCSPKGEHKGKWPFACHDTPLLDPLGDPQGDPWRGPVLAHQGTQGLKWSIHTLHTNSSEL